MKYNKALIPLFALMIILVPSLSMAYSLGSDNHTYPEVINPPLGPASVSEASSGFDNKTNSNAPAIVVNIGYGWFRLIAQDGSSKITCSGATNYNPAVSDQIAQSREAMDDFRYAVALADVKRAGECYQVFSSPYPQETERYSPRLLLLASGSGSGSGSSSGGCPVNYFMPPGSQKSKTQVKCQSRYDPVSGKWVVRYVVVFAMNPKDAQVQKVSKSGAIAYVNIDKNGHGVDVIQ